MRIELEDKELDYIAQVLAARPYSEVAQLIGKISLQVQAQNVKPEEPSVPKPHAVG